MRGLLSLRSVAPLMLAICWGARPASAMVPGAFAGGQSWGGGVGTDGVTLFIDNDGDGTPESYAVPAELTPTAAFTFLLSTLRPPRSLYAVTDDPSCGGAGSARALFYDVVQDNHTAGHLTAVTNVCIPNGIAFDGYVLGQQSLAFVAGISLPADTTQTMFWIDLDTGGTGASQLTRDLDNVGFPQFPPSVTVALTREVPVMSATATYHLVDLCPATLGSLLNPGGGMLANLPAPEPAAAVVVQGGGYVVHVSHPSLPAGSIDVPITDCLAAGTTTTSVPASTTLVSTTSTSSTTTTTLPPIVTTTDPYADGGLLDVIGRVNAGQPGPVTFAIPGPGPYVIDLAGSPIFVTASMVIDGTSQQSAQGTPLVQIHNGSLQIQAAGCIVEGLAIDTGILLQPPATGTLIQNNYVGIAPDGVTRNAVGGARVSVGTPNNTIQDNVIANGVTIGENAGDPPAIHNVVRGNRMGTNAAGTAMVPTSPGLVSVNSADNVIGGTGPNDGNLIAGSLEIGSASPGFLPSSSDGNSVAGNLMGTDVTGESLLTGARVSILNASHNVVGPKNVVPGGMFIQGGSANTIAGNLIGTDVTGTRVIIAALNGGYPGPGIQILNSSDNVIGGTIAGDGNVIAGHASAVQGLVTDGILIDGLLPDGSSGNQVLGNFVGTDATGTVPLPNDVGIDIVNATANTVIGGTAQGAGNVIYFNRGVGVRIVGGSGNTNGNTVAGNSIDQNGFGIEVSNGANDGIAAPVLTHYSGGLMSTFVGHATGPPNGSLTIEFFGNPLGDGEGRALCGRKTYAGDAGGNVTFMETIACPVTDPAEAATGTATATDAAGNTSEFSMVTGTPTVSTTTSTTRPAPTSTVLPTTTTTTTLPLDSVAGVLAAIALAQETLQAAPQPDCTPRCHCSVLASILGRVARLVTMAQGGSTPKQCRRDLNGARRIASLLHTRVRSLSKRKCLAPPTRGTTLVGETLDLATRIGALSRSGFCARR